MKAENKNIQKIMLAENDDNYIGKTITFDFISGILEYKNTISPTLGAETFRPDFFDVNTVYLDFKTAKLLLQSTRESLSAFQFKNSLGFLPPGASFKAFICYVDNYGGSYYYTYPKLSENGCFEKSEPLKNEFRALFNLFSTYCTFQNDPFNVCISDAERKLENIQSKDDDETGWICPKCMTANSFRDKACSKCGYLFKY